MLISNTLISYKSAGNRRFGTFVLERWGAPGDKDFKKFIILKLITIFNLLFIYLMDQTLRMKGLIASDYLKILRLFLTVE